MRAPAIWQPRQPVLWVSAVLVLATVVITVISLAGSVGDPMAALAALVLVGVQVVLLGLIVRAMPRFRRQRASLMLLAVLWGVTVVPGVAMIANSTASELLHAYGLENFSASLSAPVNEDLMRLLGVLAVLSLASRRRLTVMDGAVYGFLVGAGFEVLENLLYALRGASFGETISVGVMRLLVGFGLHALWTTAAGAGLAFCLARPQQGLPGRWWVLVPAVLIPMLLHAGWDAPSPSVFPVLKLAMIAALYLASVALFLGAVAWGRRSEYAWYLNGDQSALPLQQFRALPRSQRRQLAKDAVAASETRLVTAE